MMRPRGGRTPGLDAAGIPRLTTQAESASAARWSTRMLAGESETLAQHAWEARGLKPHWVRRFKLSRDPRLVEQREGSSVCIRFLPNTP